MGSRADRASNRIRDGRIRATGSTPKVASPDSTGAMTSRRHRGVAPRPLGPCGGRRRHPHIRGAPRSLRDDHQSGTPPRSRLADSVQQPSRRHLRGCVPVADARLLSGSRWQATARAPGGPISGRPSGPSVSPSGGTWNTDPPDSAPDSPPRSVSDLGRYAIETASGTRIIGLPCRKQVDSFY